MNLKLISSNPQNVYIPAVYDKIMSITEYLVDNFPPGACNLEKYNDKFGTYIDQIIFKHQHIITKNYRSILLIDILSSLFLFAENHKEKDGLLNIILEQLNEVKNSRNSECVYKMLTALISSIQGFTDNECLMIII